MSKPASIITLEFCTGTAVLEVLSEMKEKAIKFDVAFTYSKLNDVEVYVSQNANIKETYELYQEALRRTENKFVCR